MCGLAPCATPVSGTLCLTCVPGFWQALGVSANSWVPGPMPRGGTKPVGGDPHVCAPPALAPPRSSSLSFLGPERVTDSSSQLSLACSSFSFLYPDSVPVFHENTCKALPSIRVWGPEGPVDSRRRSWSLDSVPTQSHSCVSTHPSSVYRHGQWWALALV